MKSFENKVAAITGAGSGMGRSLAQNLAAQGCHLALSDVNTEGLEETRRLLDGSGVTVTCRELDVANREAVYVWADETAEQHGRVNLIFNNAGVAHSCPIADLDYDDLEWIMNINLWGVIYGTKAFLPHLEAAGDGHIVNTSSLFGLTAQPFVSSYNITKFGVRGFTESLRQELDLSGSCVSATSVHPGGIKTNIARAGRVSDSMVAHTGKTPEESARDFERFFRTTADAAAKVILRGVQKNRRRVLIGSDAKLLDLIARIFPSGYQRIFIWGARREMRQ